MSEITETVELRVPVREAYEQWTMFESFPRFMEGVRSVRRRGDGMTHWTVNVGGVEREFDAQILEQIPLRRVSWRSIAGPKHAGTVEFEALGPRSTRVTAKMDLDPEGFVENVADRLGVLGTRVKGDLIRFKDYLETGISDPDLDWQEPPTYRPPSIFL